MSGLFCASADDCPVWPFACDFIDKNCYAEPYSNHGQRCIRVHFDFDTQGCQGGSDPITLLVERRYVGDDQYEWVTLLTNPPPPYIDCDFGSAVSILPIQYKLTLTCPCCELAMDVIELDPVNR